MAAHAQATLPCEDWLNQPPAPGQSLEPLISQALELERQCPRHPGFLYHLGSLLNQAQRYDQALDRLEGALMRQPDHWPTQLEYAIALAGVGDQASATALLHDLTHNPMVDAATHTQITTLLAQAPSAPPPPSAPKLMVSLATGYDDNLLGSSDLTQFELTLVDGRLPVETDPEQRPKSGNFVRADIRYNADLLTTPTAVWRTSLVVSQRSSPQASQARLSHTGVLLERQPQAEAGLYLLGLHQELVRAGHTELRQTQLGLGLERNIQLWGQACRQRLLLDWQEASYPATPVLDGHYTGLSGQTFCPGSGVQVHWRLGRDTPMDTTRPGAAQNQASLRLAKSIPMGRANLGLEAEFSVQMDSAGYSPLLENNTARRIQRNTWRLEYSWPVGKLNPYVGIEWVDGRANLPLFDVRNRLVTLGLRTQW